VLAERAGKFAGKLAAEAQQGLMEAAHSAAQPLVKYGVHKVIGKYLPDRFYTQAKNWARKNAFEACFTAGTPLEFQYGAKAIELAKSYEEFGDDCDWIISRDENDPEGALTVRRVLKKFVRLAPVLNLHVGGKVIGTTVEHPFRVKGKGWTPAQELRAGDEIRLMGPGWTTVEGIADSGLITTVYNLEIEGDHTYFVGCAEWGFSVWAHNAYGSNNLKTASAAKTGQEAHRQIQKTLRYQGWETEVTMTLKGGVQVRKDAADQLEVLIIKPNTPSGRQAGTKRAKLMEANDMDVAVFYYDPTNPAYQPGSPTYIGPK